MAYCNGCGLPYSDPGFCDLLIPNWAFERINGSLGGLLCPGCIIRRCAEAGLQDVPFAFRSGPLQIGEIDLKQAAK